VTNPLAAPRIETERLVLRGFKRGDFDTFCAIRDKPDVMRHLGAAMTRTQLWEKFLRVPGMWPVLGHGGWLVVDKASGRQAGDVTIADFMRAPATGVPELPELGSIFDSDFHGMGYASEALAAVLGWSDANLGTGYCCIIAPANAPSIRLAERHGFVAQRETVHLGAPILLFERPAP